MRNLKNHLVTEKDSQMQSASDEQNDREPIVVPVIKEVLDVRKEVIETGRVKVTKHVVNETREINMPLTNEEVHIERIPRGHYVESAPPPFRYEDDTIVIPILKEEYVKRIMLVEEIRITKRVVSSEFKQEVTLQSEEVEITYIKNNEEQKE